MKPLYTGSGLPFFRMSCRESLDPRRPVRIGCGSFFDYTEASRAAMLLPGLGLPPTGREGSQRRGGFVGARRIKLTAYFSEASCLARTRQSLTAGGPEAIFKSRTK
jgi:hypothetical protein